MRILTDFEGNEIELSDSAIAHIRREHPRVFRIPNAIELTLSEPDRIEPSLIEQGAYLYIRDFLAPNMGKWQITVVVKFEPDRNFIKTVYPDNLDSRRRRRRRR